MRASGPGGRLNFHRLLAILADVSAPPTSHTYVVAFPFYLAVLFSPEGGQLVLTASGKDGTQKEKNKRSVFLKHLRFKKPNGLCEFQKSQLCVLFHLEGFCFVFACCCLVSMGLYFSSKVHLNAFRLGR